MGETDEKSSGKAWHAQEQLGGVQCGGCFACLCSRKEKGGLGPVALAGPLGQMGQEADGPVLAVERWIEMDRGVGYVLSLGQIAGRNWKLVFRIFGC
jgi:hypothetical protein